MATGEALSSLLSSSLASSGSLSGRFKKGDVEEQRMVKATQSCGRIDKLNKLIAEKSLGKPGKPLSHFQKEKILFIMNYKLLLLTAVWQLCPYPSNCLVSPPLIPKSLHPTNVAYYLHVQRPPLTDLGFELLPALSKSGKTGVVIFLHVVEYLTPELPLAALASRVGNHVFHLSILHDRLCLIVHKTRLTYPDPPPLSAVLLPAAQSLFRPYVLSICGHPRSRPDLAYRLLSRHYSPGTKLPLPSELAGIFGECGSVVIMRGVWVGC
eukprot:1383679-Amorphochlora_amoeboformis.AAC.2